MQRFARCMARCMALPVVLLMALLAGPAARQLRADIDPSWLGAWMGEVQSPPVDGKSQFEMPVTIVVRSVEAKADGATQARSSVEIDVTILRAGAMAKPAVEVVANGRNLAFTLDSQGRRARFEGALEPAAAEPAASPRVVGTFAFLLEDGGKSDAFEWTMRRVDLAREQANARLYRATLDAQGQKLPMGLALAEGPHGWCASMEIASQGVLDLAVEVARTDAGFTIRMPVGVIATIQLVPNADSSVLEGTFEQGTFKGPIRFELAAGERLRTKRRPQDPEPPFPYDTRDVRINHPAGHVLAGTLSMPREQSLARDGRVPAVVLVTGSGPQNRDEELLGHRPFAVIADALARAGIAVLRCDDRGVGDSTGSFAGATTIDLASDADIASQWLNREPGIDPARVGMIGHSEGALIVPLVALWQHDGDAPVHPLAFGIALAMPAESGAATLTRQSDRIMELSGIEEAKRTAAIDAHRAVMAAAAARGASAEPGELERLVKVMVRAQIVAGGLGPVTDAQLSATAANAYAQIIDPWMSGFIAYDPAPVLARLEMPMVAVYGGKDVQVVAEPNATLATKIVRDAGGTIVTRVHADANHLFQPAVTGLPDEYGSIETTIDPAILAELVRDAVALASRGPVAQIRDEERPAAWRATRDDSALPPRRWILQQQERVQ